MGSRTASETDVIDRPASSSISEKAQDETSRKRKIHRNGSDYDDDDTGDDKSVKTTDDNKKQNHSEIEKRRRDKMNTYISELSGMIPMCHAMSRKLDKLTVLRMAVQHLKAIRGAAPSYAEGRFKPACLSDQELKSLILQTAEGFLFVVGCDRGRILFVSESVSQTLNYTQGDLLGQSWFDILHPKDVAKVKEQLSSSDLSPRERLIDAKTMLPLRSDVLQGASKLCSGARRSFFCRMKYKVPTDVKEESESHSRRKSPQGSDRKYCVIQCTGYLKSWAPVKLGCGALEEAEGEADGDDAGSGSLSCLVAVGRLQGLSPTLLGHGAPPVRTVQFISRHAMDGKFIFVDQRSTLVLGFLPQELLGTSMYEYYHPDDISSLADTHKLALLSSPPVRTPPYRLRTKEGTYVTVQSDWKSFKNPWTKEVECLVAKNSVTLCHPTGNLNNLSENVALNMGAFDFCSHNDEVEIANYINTQVESNKIGCQVAEEALDTQRLSAESPGIGSSPDSLSAEIVTSYVTLQPQDTMAVNSLAISNNLEPLQNSKTLANFEHVRNLTLGNTPDEDIMEMIGSTGNPQASTTLNSSDGNDEAAMAVIMSLLEADAGLGGPVDFSGLPWPLP